MHITSRYINKKYGFVAGPNCNYQGKFYILQNLSTIAVKSNAIMLFKLDIVTKEKIPVGQFESIADVRRYFSIKPAGHNWYSDYVKTGKPYKKEWFMEDVSSDTESDSDS